MKVTGQLAKHLREVHFGGNWTSSNFRDQLKGLHWQKALKSVYGLNSIALLFFHSTYYVRVLAEVLNGKKLEAKDEWSFQLPDIASEKDWENLVQSAWANAEEAAAMLEKMDDARLAEDFTDKKYGSYFRNISGTVEHLHYHLGQIVLIRKILEAQQVQTKTHGDKTNPIQ
ncbi:MAG TPA: DUF1572 domain-containing protein [Bacteroidia bacterium]|nr:DUF1572 domain-containing protein [Bacteroidia bacterium]